MKFIKSSLPDVVIIEPKVYEDSRGYFVETFRRDKFEDFIGKKIDFCQDNESKSNKGVFRGLHYQLPPFAQSKLVRVIKGRALDIAVDIRKESLTFGKYVVVELSEANKRQLFIPRGFAHGFLTLENETIFSYKVDNYYSPTHDRGIRFDDALIDLKIDFPKDSLIISDKDKKAPFLKDAEIFKYGIDYYE